MRKKTALMTLSLAAAILTTVPAVARIPLRPVSDTQRVQKQNTDCCQTEILGLDEQIFWGQSGQPGDKHALLTSIDHSLRYIKSPAATAAYRRYRGTGITRDRVQRSLERFRQLVVRSNSPEELQAAVSREFVFYQSTGRDGKGDVLYTAYYEPIYQASRVPTAEFRYPLYRLPPNFKSWRKPHPTRQELEGKDGLLGDKSRLKGLEIVWLRDRLEAFLAQIQGSARLQLADGKMISIGFAGKTDYPYTSIGKELAKDGKLPLAGLTLPVMIDYFTQYPAELNNYLPRNRGFVFFRETGGAPAVGSLGVPVTADRSIATDKSLMPPGALALIHTQLPFPNDFTGSMEYRLVSRYVLDQDTGGAIKGPGRVDYFMGTGKLAGDRAGVTGHRGHLYYLLLK
ncbi:murein transglycosylase A [Chroogloeocystis siderophila]|jgi:membrane-bound lytic murein transglycosylase A|uniref:peptidoglycan lytic exotransglycosylase n=1 Tax=Chroogloeocystis siderophila 5.2 s.c.1 TaxID=247279 RepID=A0A1U7HHS0_9CHRO|nr:murein transglycosylase A [Chroogloeocystis siderophila]OKH23130.1 murein transglycosylase [Chroogloeocystis siderophila 5.2 s.c.1]